MADNLKIIITTEDKDLVRSLKRADALESGVKFLSKALVKGRVTYAKYNKAVAELAEASGRSKKELLAFGKSLRRTEKSTNDAKVATKALAAAKKKAADADRAFAAQNKKAIADAKALAAEEERLKQKFVAGHAAMNIYSRELNDLSQARQRGIITTDQQTAAVARLNAQMIAGTGAFAGQSAAIGNSKNRMNGSNMAIQQLGYQFGDFAVQVQGGTSAFVAFSQQGAQLAGILPMIAGPLGMSMKMAVGLSAALGILIPIGSAVARMFFEMKGKAEGSAASFDKVSESLSTIDSTDMSKFGNDFLGIAKGIRNEFSGVLGIIKEIAIFDLKRNISKPFDDLIEKLTKYEAANNLSLQLDLEPVDFNILGLDSMNQAMFVATQLKTLTGETRSELIAQVAAIQEAVELRGVQSIEVKRLIASISDEIGLVEEVNDLFKDGIDKLKEQNKNEGLINLFLKAQQRIRNENGSLMQEALDLEKEVSKAARDTNWEKTQAKKVQQDSFEATRKVYELEKDIRKELGESAFQALKLSNVDIESGVSAAAKQAAILASKLGIAFSSAQGIQLMQLSERNANTVYSGRGSVGMPKTEVRHNDGSGEFKPSKDLIKEADILLGLRKPDKDKKSSKVVNINEIIAARKAQADQERILLGLSGEEQDAQRIYFQLQKQNEKATIQTSDIKLQGYAKEIAAQREQNRVIEEAAKQQEQLADFIDNSMENAMMSIVDSTISVEDAFKSMAASIIKELYRVLVVQKIVAAAKAFLGFADGGVVQQGAPTTSLRPMARPQANGGVFTKVNAYANGGVVSSPTTFPMSGNQTGLMGEAGAEAIMPLKRGRNGKLGVQAEGNAGGDVIHISQSFSFQANGDDTIKSLIAQAAPKIAQMTKSSLLEDRRRGGRTKAAFG